MPGEIDLPIPDPGSLTRGRFTYFPGRARAAWNSPSKCAQAILRDRPAGHRAGTARHAAARLAARRRAPAGNVRHRLSGRERGRGSGRLRPDRAGRPVHRGHPHGPRDRRRDRLRRSRCRRAPAPQGRLSRHRTRSGTSASTRYIEAYRVYPQPRSDEIARHAAGIAWKLQGADPLARVLVVISLNLLDPVLDAMEEPQAQPLARTRREGIELLNPHPESLAEILLEYPRCSGATRTFAA